MPPVPGAVFTCPTPDQMLAATKAVDGGAGVLHIVKNYTGDVLNFEMAAELASADGDRGRERRHRRRRRGEGQPLHGRPARRRRHRAWPRRSAAARAEARLPLAAGRRPVPAGSTPTAAAWAWRSPPAPCRMPASRPSISPRTRWRWASASTASRAAGASSSSRPTSIAEMLMEPILDDLPFRAGDGVLLFVNGMGGTPADRALRASTARRTRSPRRRRSTWCATWWATTSPAWKWRARPSPCSGWTTKCCRCWDAPVLTPALRWGMHHEQATRGRRDADSGLDSARGRGDRARERHYLTELDSPIGDGDHGVNMARGFSCGEGQAGGAPPADIGAAAQDGGHDADPHGRRRLGAALRHVVPAGGEQRRAARRSCDRRRLDRSA